MFKCLPKPITACLILFFSLQKTVGGTVVFFRVGGVHSLLTISEKLMSFCRNGRKKTNIFKTVL